MENTSAYLQILEDTILFVPEYSSVHREVINTQLNETEGIQTIRWTLPEPA